MPETRGPGFVPDRIGTPRLPVALVIGRTSASQQAAEAAGAGDVASVRKVGVDDVAEVDGGVGELGAVLTHELIQPR